MKLTEDIELGEENDNLYHFRLSDCFPDIKQQILDDHEKARKLEEVLPAYEQSLILHSNLRKFIEEEFQHYDTTFKKHKDIDDFKVAQVLQKILRRNKK